MLHFQLNCINKYTHKTYIFKSTVKFKLIYNYKIRTCYLFGQTNLDYVESLLLLIIFRL